MSGSQSARTRIAFSPLVMFGWTGGVLLELGLLLLEVRARAKREIETRLTQKGYEEGIIEQVIEKLVRLELINDAQFAAAWVEAKTRVGGNRPVGRRRLSSELYAKGVAKDQIAEAVGIVSNSDELVLARAAAAKKVRTVPTDRDLLQAERRKLMGFLQRRGFGWETVKQVTRESLPAKGDAEEDDEFDPEE